MKIEIEITEEEIKSAVERKVRMAIACIPQMRPCPMFGTAGLYARLFWRGLATHKIRILT